MTLLARLQNVNQTRCDLLARAGRDPFGVVIERILSPTEALIDGRPVLLAGTNNYLGLTFDPACIAAAQRALAEEGTGTTGSRMANGTYFGHRALESELAAFFGCRQAIVFSTGFTANLGTIAALAAPGTALLIDADCHASVYDGCRMSGAEVFRFRHNSPEDLEKKLRRLGNRTSDTLIVVEGLYSMRGDRAPLPQIAAIKEKYGAWLLLDEAHSLGVLGAAGRGLAEEAGVEAAVDFRVGTFSKSLGAIGGFCVSDHAEFEAIRYVTRSYIFTASPSPATIASVREALAILRSRPQLRTRLWENVHRLYTGLQKSGFDLGPEPSPIVAVHQPSAEAAVAAWLHLLQQGIYVNLVLPPAAPDERSLLRCSVSVAHSFAQIDRIVNSFAALTA